MPSEMMRFIKPLEDAVRDLQKEYGQVAEQLEFA